MADDFLDDHIKIISVDVPVPVLQEFIDVGAEGEGSFALSSEDGKVIARILEECERYGLPTTGKPIDVFEGLLRHIYANRDLTIALLKKAAELPHEQIGVLCIQGHPHRICSGCTSACREPVFGYPETQTKAPALKRASDFEGPDGEGVFRIFEGHPRYCPITDRHGEHTFSYAYLRDDGEQGTGYYKCSGVPNTFAPKP